VSTTNSEVPVRDMHCYAIDSTVGRLFGRHFYGVRLQPLEDG
jgi:hypothetical protein